MELFFGKAFARKHAKARGTTGRPVTMILVLVDGDVPSLTDEAMHGLQICDTGGSIQISITGMQPTGERFDGLRADQVLTLM